MPECDVLQIPRIAGHMCDRFLRQLQARELEEAHFATILLRPCGCDALDFPRDAAQHALLESPAEQDCMPELPPGLRLLSGLVSAQPRLPQRAVAQ